MEDERYSLWFIPKREVYAKLSHLINQLSKAYGSPLFEPHVTLLGRILVHQDEVIQKAKTTASVLKPFSITMNSVGYEESYFSALYLKVDANPSLITANQVARKFFRSNQKTEYKPHLSIIYGNFTSEEKQKMILRIGNEINNLIFPIDRLYVMRRNPKVLAWQYIDEIPFT